MSQRIPKVYVAPSLDTDVASRVLTFKPFKTVDKDRGVSDKSGNRQLRIYEVFYGNLIFGYLYVTSEQYSLVWKSSTGFKFELPYTQVELQFSNFPTWRINDLKPCLPLRNHPLEMKGYDNQKVTATLFLSGEDQVREFDLRDEKGKDAYRSELLDQQPESLSRIAFARYDSEILYRGEPQKICFTAERLSPEANDDWEFVINLSRRVVLNRRCLRWVVKNHESSKSMLKIDFAASHVALSGVLSR